MKLNVQARLFAIAASLTLLATPVRAQTTYFGSDASRFTPTNAAAASASWFAAMALTGTETFESATDLRPNQPLNFGALGVGNLADPQFFGSFGGLNGLLAVPSLGNIAYGTAFGGTTALPMALTFGPVNGFSMWATGLNDIGAGRPSIVLDFFAGSTLLYQWVVNDPSTSGDNTMFLGIAGLTGLDRVNLYGQNGDGVWIDDVSIGNGTDVVPEPATMTLLATGLAGMAAARRRKKNAA